VGRAVQFEFGRLQPLRTRLDVSDPLHNEAYRLLSSEAGLLFGESAAEGLLEFGCGGIVWIETEDGVQLFELGLCWHPLLRLTVTVEADYAAISVILEILPLVHFGE
jgi:hypothetical protein